MFRRRRRVRIHQHQGPTYEGLQVGRRPRAGAYVLVVAKVLEEAEGGRVLEHALDARQVEIPAGRVIAVEVLA